MGAPKFHHDYSAAVQWLPEGKSSSDADAQVSRERAILAECRSERASDVERWRKQNPEKYARSVVADSVPRNRFGGRGRR